MPEATIDASDASRDAMLPLKIRLLAISPMIWRRMLAPAMTTLLELHDSFQVTMGWEGIRPYYGKESVLDYQATRSDFLIINN